MSIELISFKLCPYVQRSLITLLHKGVEHRITYIDLADPPDWFVDISPLQKVPLLRVDGAVLFESAVINEYLDETTGAPLMPADALSRAVHRGWIEFGSELLGDQWRLSTQSGERYSRARESLLGKLRTLQSQLDQRGGDGPFFAGDQLSLVDTAYAPFFMRHALLDGPLALTAAGELPRLERWSAALLALPAVRQSVVAEFESLFRDYVRDAGGCAGELI